VLKLKGRVTPNVPHTGNRVWKQKQPELLAGFDVVAQERVNDANVSISRGNQCSVSFVSKTNMLSRSEFFRSGYWSDRDVNRIAMSVAVFNELAKLCCFIHIQSFLGSITRHASG